MVAMDQVVPDNQVDPEEDFSVVLITQNFGHTEHVAAIVVQQVVPMVGRFSPQEHKIVLVDSEVDQTDRRVVHVGPKVDLVDRVVVPVDQKQDRMVVRVDQKHGHADLKVVPERVVLVSQGVS